MRRKTIINKLSSELAAVLGREDSIALIKQFITAAMVTEMERSPGHDLRIIQKIDPQSGCVLDEYWGMKDVYLAENFSNHFETVQRAIDRACTGDRNTAYGFCWKKAS